jgi:hypothetical protein
MLPREELVFCGLQISVGFTTGSTNEVISEVTVYCDHVRSDVFTDVTVKNVVLWEL